MSDFFGAFFDELKANIADTGSELGTGMMLFSLAVAIQAEKIIEIGRYKGFSTLALAGALRFLDEGWTEPTFHEQRPDVDYARLNRPRLRALYSIDPMPTVEARRLIARNDLGFYVEWINQTSEAADLGSLKADLIFIDGDHSYEGIKRDVEKYVPLLREGGYFILHDYYGWYAPGARGALENGSPIAKYIDDSPYGDYNAPLFGSILIDTHYQSLVICRK